MKPLMPDTSGQIPIEVKLVFSRCDICEKEYGEEEMKLKKRSVCIIRKNHTFIFSLRLLLARKYWIRYF